jgi:hypothetical protein
VQGDEESQPGRRWVPTHEANPQGLARRAAHAAIPPAAWNVLPGRMQGKLCGCATCRGETPHPTSTTTEGNTMSQPSYKTGAFGKVPSNHGAAGDTTYTQQMSELEAIRRDAEEEVSSVRRKRMVSRLDILQSLGLDKNSLSEAAAIDDALQAQEKAAQQTLDAADAAIHGLKQRHGGIKEAVDNSPVDKSADPEFYQD